MNRLLAFVFVALSLASGIRPAVKSVVQSQASFFRDTSVAAIEMPEEMRSYDLEPMGLKGEADRFARYFPGKIEMYSFDGGIVILRQVNQMTRSVHPAQDCFKGAGYKVALKPHFVDAGKRMWGTFGAERGSENYRVRERIIGKTGGAWTDVSSWFWAGVLGQTSGGWIVITLVERI